MVVLLVVTLLGGSATAQRDGGAEPGTLAPAVPTPEAVLPLSAAAPAVPAALFDPAISLRDGPVDVPLELRIPALDVRAPVAGVGITPTDVMDAPMGPAGDPVWQKAFWYRGSAVPGARSTALIAGHVNGPGGRSAVFTRLGDLRPGDPILVRDTRTGLDVAFSVDGSTTYSLAEAAQPAALERIYGAGPVAGTAPQPSADGLAHLSLITCAGTFRNGTRDQRLVVSATRVTD